MKRPIALLRTITTTAMLAVVPALANAHPHVWITDTAVAQMHGNALYAVQERWLFSKGFPVSLAGDMSGLPRSGPVDEKHTAMLKAQAFSSLKGADYFTHVFVDGKPVAIGEARDFSVSVENGRIVYTFVVPLATSVDVTHASVELGIWDDTFFVDFQPGSPPVAFDAGATKACTAQSFEDRQHSIFSGSIFPQSNKLSC
ncbi:MAG TPA: DUF1007 family protein [Paraburkholderia sp.]|nr:DUF1007 family protein [Paraburkholderia sp.]